MAPRIYMAGACASLPDLGVAWRRKAAAAIREAGGVAIWPPDVYDVAYGMQTEAQARSAWADKRSATRLRLECLGALGGSEAVLLLNDGRNGTGTEAERAFAVWDSIPIEFASDETDIPRAAKAAVERAKKRQGRA